MRDCKGRTLGRLLAMGAPTVTTPTAASKMRLAITASILFLEISPRHSGVPNAASTVGARCLLWSYLSWYKVYHNPG